MRISTAAIHLTALVGLTVAKPASNRVEVNNRQGFNASEFLDDGFPDPSDEQALNISTAAGGTLPNAPPPDTLADSSLTAFQLIAFNENFEVAFFQSMLKNLTNGTYDKELPEEGLRDNMKQILTTIRSQEELHAIDARKVLEHFNATAPDPCTYKFPTTTLRDAITLANTFTTVVLGALQDASLLLAKNNDTGPVGQLASVIGQEGEQNGFFRTALARVPSSKPFLTLVPAPYAFSALQQFIVECPFNSTGNGEIGLPVFPPLEILSGSKGLDVEPRDQVLNFAVNVSDMYPNAQQYVGRGTNNSGSSSRRSHKRQNGGDNGGNSSQPLYVTYLIGQNVPVSEQAMNVTWNGQSATFQANFPFEENVAYGLSIAALTTGSNYTDVEQMVNETVAAPGLIQVNDKLNVTWLGDLFNMTGQGNGKSGE